MRQDPSLAVIRHEHEKLNGKCTDRVEGMFNIQWKGEWVEDKLVIADSILLYGDFG